MMKEEEEDNHNSLIKKNQANTNSVNISIEDLEANPSLHLKISSPRSILALKSCGITADELYQITFKEYKQRFYETKTLPIDIQVSRYQFYESRRIDKVNKVKEKRNTIDLNENNNRAINQSHSLKVSHSCELNSISNSLMDRSEKNFNRTSIINKDMKELEMMKKKAQSEMLNIIQSEIRLRNMINEAERKSNLQKERFSRSQEEQRIRKEEEDQSKKEKEDQRFNRQKEGEERENRRKRDLERKKEEKRHIDEEKEKQKEEELKQKKEEESLRQKQFQEKIDKIYNEQQKMINKKQQLLMTRDKDRLSYMEQQRSVQAITKMEKIKSKADKINNNRSNLEEKMRSIHDALVQKQQLKENKMGKFEAQQQQLYQKQRDLSLRKQIEIKTVLERNQVIEKQKIIEFDKKKERITEKKFLFEKMMNEEKEKLRKQNEAKAEHIKSTLLKNERQEIVKKEYLLNKREEKDESLQKVMDKKRTENISKAEELNKKHYLIEDNFKMIARVHEYDIEKVKIRQNVKDRRIDDFMKQKRYMIDKKKELHEELSKIKQNFMSRFHDVTRKKYLDSTTIESFRDFFPSNPSFDRMVHQFNNQTHGGLFFTNSGLSRPNRFTQQGTYSQDHSGTDDHHIKNKKQSHSVRNVNVPLKLEVRIAAIQERVTEYRQKLNQELLLLIQEERQKEMEREKMMNNHPNFNEKKRLEELFGLERGKASLKITRLNE